MSVYRLAQWTGLGAALVGVLCGFRGSWPESCACAVIVLVCSVLEAVWEPAE